MSRPFDISVDVPYAGVACDRDDAGARRVTVGQVSQLKITHSERESRLAGVLGVGPCARDVFEDVPDLPVVLQRVRGS